jgi:S1-C subfamily serine protease
MNMRLTGTLAGCAAALWLVAPAAGAQAPGTAERDNARVEAEERKREAEERMREAEQRLQEAAREIAELTTRLMGEAGSTALHEISVRARRAMLGINIGPVGGPDAREDGVRILGVTPGGPAAQAGLRSDDVLIAIDGRALDWSDEQSPVHKLQETLKGTEPGTQLELEYRRGDETAQVSVEARPWSRVFFDPEALRGLVPPDGPGAPVFLRRMMIDTWGDMELVTLSPGLGDYFEVDEGVLVVRAPADPALGLRDGDVIVDIAGRKPVDPGHVVRILRSYAPGERLVMTVVRQGRRQTLEADIP